MSSDVEHVFELFAAYVALAVELAAVLAVAVGAAEAAIAAFGETLFGRTPRNGRAIWIRFASWILLALEFALGADIIRTAIAPRWDEIGQLAAIAAIRTFLNYFLAKDIESAEVQPDS